MNGLSDDESSDSSDEFLVAPEKINFNSSFFTKKSKVNLASATVEENNSTDDDEDLDDVSHGNSAELFSQVLKNLEITQKSESPTDDSVEPYSIAGVSTNTPKKLASSNEINDLLFQGESGLSHSYVSEPTDKKDEEPVAPEEYSIPKEGVKITLPGTSLFLQRKKRGGPDLKAILRRRLRESQILVEKVGLLCWLAYGFHLNRQINEPEIMSSALSLLSATNYPKNRIDLTYLEKFTKFFKNSFSVQSEKADERMDKEELLKMLGQKKVPDYKALVVLYIAALRALGLQCRLVVSLCPPLRKISNDMLADKDQQGEGKAKTDKPKRKTTARGKSKQMPDDKAPVENSPEGKKNANLEAKKRAAEILRASKSKRSDKSEDNKLQGSSVKKKGEEKEEELTGLRRLRSRTVLTAASKETKSERRKGHSSSNDGTVSKYYKEDTDSEGEFEEKPKRAPKKQPKAKPEAVSTSRKPNRKLLSSDSEEEESEGTGKSEDVWAEVYLESEESWICVSVINEKVHCIAEIYRKAKKPVLYVIAWNSEGKIKDVTRKYCANWLTVTRKKRIDEKWWSETVSIWKESSTAISKAEDEMLLQKELEQPLPKTIGEYKGHPLYVLARHLLKFEGLYPPDCVPLGHTKTGEAVYSRHCVHTLCSREKWLRQARVVKPKQEAYKIVKSRLKFDKLSGMKLKDEPLELFGMWQTMEYEPPVAKDGIVPRNEYGNVDLFQQSMLPKGTVHIDLPALNRVARKLNIDCAPAVVGFNFGSMGSVPAFEGFVVCEEFEDTLREAWEAEQVEAAKRAKEKYEKRVYGNWKRLIQGLRIRERLAAKYEFEKEEKVPAKRTKQKRANVKKAKVV